MSARSYRITVIFGVLGWLVIFAMAALSVRAHGWYDPACCSGFDCAPDHAGLVEEKADGVHVLGFGVLAYTDPRLRKSRDYEDHVCISRGAVPGTSLVCLFATEG